MERFGGFERGERPATVVLVPGGFLGPWIWAEVAALLRGREYSVVTPDLPSVTDPGGGSRSDFAADAAMVRGVLDAADPPVVLVGHSYGGAVVTEAAAGPHPAVRHLVYVTAEVPDAGPRPAPSGPAPGHEWPTSTVTLQSDGSLVLDPDAAAEGLFHDCDAARRDEAVRALRPMNGGVGRASLTGAAWRDLPATVVRGLDDRLQEATCSAFLATGPEVVELPTGHCPNWSRPDLVAALITRVVEKLPGWRYGADSSESVCAERRWVVGERTGQHG